MHPVIPATGNQAKAAIALLAGAAGLLLATFIAGRALCPDARCLAPESDLAVLRAFHVARAPKLDALMAAVTWLGSMFVLLPAALIISLRERRRGSSAFFLAVALVGGWLLLHVAKWLVDRPRPDLFPSVAPMPGDASFPSGHTAQAAIFVFAWLATRRPDPAWAFWLAGTALVLLVGLSRLYLQVHFPTDVIAGLLFGIVWVALLYGHWPGGLK